MVVTTLGTTQGETLLEAGWDEIIGNFFLQP